MRIVPNIEIKRIKIDGLYTFDHAFSSGLHILIGSDNSCGKSLFIRLIDFALGDEGKELEDYEVLKECSFFYAEIKINGKHITIKRNIYAIDKEIEIFHDESIDTVISKNLDTDPTSIDDYRKFLFKEITGLDYINITSPKSGKKQIISFANFSNLFYLNQGVEAGQLFRYHDTYFPNHMKEKIMQIYLNSSKIAASSYEVEVINLSEKVKKSTETLNIKKSFFNSKFSSDNYFAEKEKKEILLKELAELKNMFLNLNEKILTIEDFPNEENEKLYLLKIDYDELKIKIMESESLVKQTTKILNDYSEELKKTERNMTAFNLFKKFDTKICPECNRPLKQRKENHCSLCDEILETENSEDYFKKNMSYLKYLKDSIKDSIDVITNEKKIQDELKEKQAKLSKDIKVLENLINEKIKTSKTPLIEKISHVSSEISKKEELIVHVDRNLEILESFQHELKQITELEDKIKTMRIKIKSINENIEENKRSEILLKSLENNLNSFFNEINYPGFESIFIDKNFVVRINSKNEGLKTIKEIRSASNKIIIRLGLFYALLKTALENSEIKHPRLVYLDSPRDQELKWNRFCNSLLKFRDLSISNNKSGQIFITVVEDAENKFSNEYEVLNEHVFMRLSNEDGHRLLRKKEK